MKKLLASILTIALVSLSLSFMACGDDSSSGPANGGDDISSVTETSLSGPVESSSSILDSLRNVSMKFTGCYESPYNKVALLKEAATDELPKAYLYEESGKYKLMIPKISDYCSFGDVVLDVNRFGDTLSVEVKAMIPSKCVCVSDHWFDIDASDADIQFFALKLYYNKGLQVYEVVPGPAPDEPYSSAVLPGESSSSVTPPGESSSSVTPPASSSGVTPPSSSSRQIYNGPVPLKSITATCQDNDVTDIPVVPPSPAAYLSISNSFAQIDLFNVNLTYACDSASQMAFWDSLKADNTVASVIGDTLFVNFKRFDEKGVEYKCGCTAKVEFRFDEQYAGFGYTAFENNRPPLELGHRLINQPDPGYQKIEKADAQCVNNDPTEDPLTDAAIPPVAHMYMNGDSAQVVIETVMLTCGTEFESIEAQVKDSTLYVTPHYAPSSVLADCLCKTKVSFNVKAQSPFTEATLLVYDDGSSLNLGNKMRLIVE